MICLEKTFGFNHPELIGEWSSKNSISPYEVSKASGKKYLFECKSCKSEYECSLDKKSNYNSGCPYCRGLKVNDTNSLENNNKELLKYWDYSKNINITPSQVTRNSHKKVFWKCNTCNDETFSSITGKRGCAVCDGQKVKLGYNDIKTTNPELIIYMKNISDAEKYMKYSNKKIELICPKCNCDKKMLISDLTRRGFKCTICDTNNSLGERIIHNLLSGIEYKSEVIFEWAKNKRYDFYLPKYNTIIEVHGEQHYSDAHFTNRSLAEEIQNDTLKRELAKENKISHYIELRYDSNNLKKFKLEILNSELSKLLNLKDDLELDVNTSNFDSNKIKVWNCYNENKSAKKVSEKLKISLSTVKKYLKIGNELGKCVYPRNK